MRRCMRRNRRHGAGQQTQQDHQADAEHDVAGRQHEDRQHPAGRDRRPGRRARRRSRPSPPPTRAMKSDSARTSTRIRPPEKPSVLSTASSLVRSRTDCAIVLAAMSSMVKSTADEDGDHDRADVADLLREALDESLFGRGLGLGRRVREHLVERRGSARRPERDRRSSRCTSRRVPGRPVRFSSR